ncbi:right-handed parallel beta-helix repeat-containing protein [Streptomyces johnsoniae]|uniref:Right-handed parallel beta-helix repeat-containing protein n=1 Tax=Streptomyces johnsoniae TaxID=3075532 RepID=A0ABU2S1I6_9ACTN|nr:right-handed parallel beta-helix repeat-containing protein [Streptomyces sp. DSM 41886]MDT0441450.1 right-handed parallel beta-helix repeat-containing protein [Streptomyces sp. DSM 41886]
MAGIGGTTPATAAAGTTYYVDVRAGADGNDGTRADAPWRTLDKVNDAEFAPGDTIAFRRGQDWNGALRLSDSGTAAAPITVTAYGDDQAAPPAIGDPAATECVLIEGAHWHLTGLRATGCAWSGFEVRGSHNTLAAVHADGNAAGVVVGEGAAFNTIRDSTFADNDKMSVNTPGGSDDSGAFGILINGDDNTVTRNVITGSRAESHDYGYDGAAVEIFDGDRNRVEYTIARDNLTFAELGRGPGATADDNLFAYNLVTSRHEGGAFLVTRGAEDVNGPVRGTTAVNNSVSLPGRDTEGWVCYAGCAPDILTLRNNIVSVGGQTGFEDGEGADEDHGIYHGPRAQFEPGPHSRHADPLFVSDTDPRLRPGSPAIGAGTPAGYTCDLAGRPVPAAGPDAGAYQYQP